MNLDQQRHHDLDIEVDAVVIGTGAGGAPILAVLAEAGLSVVALEAGPSFDPGDHTPDEIEGSRINWLEERLSGGADPTAFGPNNSGRGVGGSTLHWGAFAPRPQDCDLRLASTTGAGRDWPFGLDELRPYLERAESDIGVCGPTAYPWDPDRRYTAGPAARNASSVAMLRGCVELGITATDAPVAITTVDRHQDGWGLRPACVNCGACHQGCRSGAKASMDTTYLPRAVVAGAEIRPDSTVHTIERDSRGRVTAVVYRRDGVDHRQRCRHLFLCAGGVETPRLLLHTGLANGSGQVGRNFMAHGGVQVWGRHEQTMRGHRGYPSSIITEDFVRPHDADFAGGYLIQSLGVMPLTWATSLVRGAGLRGQQLVDTMLGHGRMTGVGINAECLPADGNRLVLVDEVDAIGVPKARIDFSAGPNEKAIDAHAERVLTEIVLASGARDPIVVPRTAHTIGTARMGTDPADSVVDADGRSWEIENLLICDNSIFPSSLAANPALTTMALALRTAERFLARGPS